MTELAPIIIFAYNRPDHLKTTLEYLAKNSLAAESKLFIFSDGPKNKAEEQKVESVRKIIGRIIGFKSVSPVYRKNHTGLANSVISGVSEVFEKNDAVIVIEDDLMVSRDFLKYMNDSLVFYEGMKKIFSITGYSLPLRRKYELTQDVFFLPRVGSWGWATWKDRWDLADWDVSDFKEFMVNKSTQKKFNRGGEDLTPMLKAQMNGEIDAWDIRWCYTLFRVSGLCVYPTVSRVKLIEDGKRGTHVKNNKKYRVELDNSMPNINLINNFDIDEKLLSELNRFVRPSLLRKIINYCKYDFKK